MQVYKFLFKSINAVYLFKEAKMRTAKLLVLLALAAVMFAAAWLLPERLCFDGGESYTFYCGTSSADCKEVIANENAAAVKLSLKNVCGEAVVYENFDLQSFLNKVGGKIVFKEELSDSVNYYCTADLPYFVTLYGQKINLHICVRGSSAKAASPIIFGGY